MANPDPEVASDLHDRPVDLLRELVRFETVNPPGDERPCIEWIAEVLEVYGIDSTVYADDPGRPNLLARVPGGDADPLLLYGHVDVVPVTGQDWTHDPFAGVIEDGYLWGRGALDMKAGVAMFLSAVLRLAAADETPAGDVLLLVVSDEEAGGDRGLGYLVEDHPDLFADIEYALGEFGGYSTELHGHETYPIQVAEKQVCWLEATFRGESGHGSIPRAGTAHAKVASFVDALDGSRLLVHVTSPAEAMFEALAARLPSDLAERFDELVDPANTDRVLDEMGEEWRMFDLLVHNTASPTVIAGGDKENVIPESISLTLDCRLLPGQGPDDVIEELREVTGTDASFDVIRFDRAGSDIDLGLFDLLADVIETDREGAIAYPYMLYAGTDARYLARVGVQSYGFTPMRLEAIDLMELVHSADERIPVESVEWGADRVVDVLRRYDGT